MVESSARTSLAVVERDLAPFGAHLVKSYPNLGNLLGTQLALFEVPSATPIGPMAALPGIIRLEAAGPTLTSYGITLQPLGGDAGPERSSLPAIMEMTGAAMACEHSSRGGAGVVLLVVDSGVDRSAVAPGRQVGGWTDDPDGDPWIDRTGHGGMVARLASACSPQSGIFSVKARASPDGGLLIESVLAAVDDLLPMIQENRDLRWVMNNSWGSVECQMDLYWCDMVAARLVRALDQGNQVSISFAAGNNNLICGGAPSIVAINSTEGGFTTAALDQNARPQAYSSRGPGQCFPLCPFIAVPTFGVLPWGTGWRDFGPEGGRTSSAAAMLSCALCLLRGEYPQANNTDLRVALAASATKTPGSLPFHDLASGFGMLQVDGALRELPSARWNPLYPLLAGRGFFRAPPVPGRSSLLGPITAL